MENKTRSLLRLLPLLLMVECAAAESPKHAEAKKNIVLILADDLGWADTTLYGKTSLYETPIRRTTGPLRYRPTLWLPSPLS